MFVIVWRFTTGDSAAFEEHYGPDGTWARLFRRSGDYVRTDLLKGPDAYLTLDWWASLEAYNAFREQYADDYAKVDAACEAVTTFEEKLGEYRCYSPRT
jgi:hypothetical protein